MTSNIKQSQYDNVIKKSGTTTLMGDVLSGSFKFAGVTPTELVYLGGGFSNVQTQLNGCLRDNSAATLPGNIVLSNSANNQFTLAGATPREISYIHGVTSNIQTQLNSVTSL